MSSISPIPKSTTSQPAQENIPELKFVKLSAGYIGSVSYGKNGSVDVLKSLNNESQIKIKEHLNEIAELKNEIAELEKQGLTINATTISESNEKIQNLINKIRKICSDKFIPTEKINIEVKKSSVEENLPAGLKQIRGNAFTAHANQEAYQKENVIGKKYIYQGNKKRGVEPGFEAKKNWKASDERKLNNPQHKYYTQANKWIENKLKEEGNNEVKEAANRLGYEPPLTDAQKIDQKVLDNLRQDPEIRSKIKEHFILSNKKFAKTHYVKLDYSPPDASGKVAIPIERAKGPLGPIGKKIHQMGTADTPKEKNLGAVMEAMSNDIFTALDFGGQKLKLVRAQYEDGTPKLLLDGTHVEGPSGEKFATLKGQIVSGKKNGRIEGNQVRVDGKLYPIDTQNLGESKIKALLMGDRDKIGGEGDNLGYVIIKTPEGEKARLMNIDPGKSLEAAPSLSQNQRPVRDESTSFLRHLFNSIFFEIKFFFLGSTDRMTQKNLHSNFAFDQPLSTLKDIAQKGYKNYTIFDDTLLSEKMVGMRKIIDNWDQVNKIIDAYISEFDGSLHPDLNFKEQLIEAKQRLNDRKEYFLDVFKDRINLSGPELDLLDNMEKLTSSTTNHAGKKQGVHLHHLAVIQPTRKEWKMVKANGLYTLSFQGKDEKEFQKVSIQLQRYFEKKGRQFFLPNPITPNKNEIRLTFDEKNFKAFAELLSEKAIAEFKNQPLRP